ncbi:sugar kinase [Tateyamaria sp. SN6-1]|uniref:sugar kinase n=1 Tax=Tateyamaria sp. SN6-1 TaxID=3092148 RepID=UPI0039F4EA4C
MKIAAIGEAMIELSMVGDTPQIGVAGDTLNTAIYLKRTAPDLRVDYVTRLGGDAFSGQIAAFIAAQGIGTDAIERDADKTCGLYGITTDADGERTFTYWRNQSAARAVFSWPAGPSFDVLKGYDVIYLSGISLAILPADTRDGLLRWLAGYRAGGGKVVYDSNYRPALWPDQATAQAITRQMWHMCDIALPSQDDEAAIFDETLEAVAERFTALGKSGALKRGPEGPLCLETGASGDYAPAAQVIDTTAAGDSFNGGYLGARLTGASQAEALQAGHDLAARVVAHRGAIIPA